MPINEFNLADYSTSNDKLANLQQKREHKMQDLASKTGPVLDTIGGNEFYDADSPYNNNKLFNTENTFRLGNPEDSITSYVNAPEKRFGDRQPTLEEQAAFDASMIAKDNFAMGTTPSTFEEMEDMRANPLTPENKLLYDVHMKEALEAEGSNLDLRGTQGKTGIYGRQVAQVFNPDAPNPNESLQDRLLTTGNAQMFDRGRPKSTTSGYADVDREITELMAADSTGSGLGNAAAGFATTLGEGVVNTLDLVPEAAEYAYKNIVGEGQSWSDTEGLYGEKESEAFKEWTGYNETVLNELGTEASQAIKNAWENEDYGQVFSTLAKAVTTPELAGASLGYVAGLAFPGTLAKRGVQLVSGVNKMAKAMMAADTTGKLTKAQALAKAGAKAGPGYKIANVMAGNAGYASGAEQFGRDAEELYKATYNEEMPVGQKLAARALGIVFVKMDAGMAKALVLGKDPIARAIPEMVKRLPQEMQTTMLGKIAITAGTTASRVAGAFGMEALTEGIQTSMEKVAGKYKQGEVGVGDVLEEEKYEIGGAALLGGAGGTQFVAPTIVDGVASIAKTGLEGIADAGARRADEKRQKMSDDIVDEKIATQKSKGNVYGGETVEPAEGFKPPEYIKTQVVDDEGYYNALEDEKQAVVSSLFEVANGNIVGLSEEGSKLSEADRATKFNEIKGWLDTYKEDYTVDGKVPKGVQDEVNVLTAEANKDYLADTAVDTGSVVEPTEAEVAAEEKMTEKVKEKNAFTARLNEEETEEGRIDVLKALVSGHLGYEVDDKVATEVAERVNAEYKKYQVSGFAQDMDWREVVKEYADKSGVKGETRGKAQSRKEERNDRLAIDNEAVNTVMKGEIETLEQVGTDSKTDAQVVQKLSKDNLKSADNVKTLKELDSKMEELIASTEGKELSKKMFKSGDKEGNSKRAMLIGINTINAQVQSDTQQRQAIEYDLERGPGGLEGDLKKDEYLAGREATAVQIGKDYASSYGIQLEGSPEQVYKRYKNFGNEVLDMLEKAGIAETVKGPMWSKLSDNLVEEDVKNRHYVNRPVIDSVTKKQGVVYKDRGIKLTDTKGMADKYAGTINDPYTSKYGDVAKRVAKLLLPGNILAPQEEPAKGEPEVANDVKLYKNADEKKDVASIMKALHGKSVQIKAEFLDVLDKINALKGDKTIHQAVRDNPEIAGLLGLQETGAKLLATSENGINNTNLQGISDILDSLDVFRDENGRPKKVYFEYQTDINNRITLLQTIANFQSDKAMSRRMFTGGDAVAVEGPALNFLVNSLIEELGMLSPKANSKKDYDRLVKAILNGDYKANETLGKLKQYIDALRVRDLNLDEISEGANDFGFEGKGMEFYGLIIALEEVAGTKGVGVTTTYMAEMDASASGVVNTMLNIAGRDPEGFKKILRQLNITVKDRVPTVKELVDAYSMLSDKVDENFANSIKTTKKVAVKTLVDELDSLGVNIRDLAKPVVMTWFYSAGAPAIQRELTSMVTTAVVKAAIKDNKEGKAARELITRVLGKPYSIAMVKNIEPRSEEHIKLVDEFNQLGETYNSTLKDAFPQVEAYKEDMEEMFGALDQYGKITDGHDGKPKEFWKGRIRSAFAALNSDLREMGKDGFTSLYKRKLKAIDKVTDDELMMITEMMANISSTLPLHAHNIDAAQLLTALAEVVFEDDVQGMLTVHDAIYANPNTLLRLQEAYNKSAIDIALKYDMLDNMVLSAEWTIGEMEAYLKEHGSNASVEENIKALTKVTDAMREKNQKFMDAKADLLKGAKAKVFGVQDVDKAKGAGEVKAEPKVEKKVEPKPKDEETKEPEVDTSTVFDEVPTVEDAVAVFVAKPSQESIKTMLNELLKFNSSNRGRVSRIIGDIDSKVESLDFQMATDADRTKFGQTGVGTSFMVMYETGKSTIYIGESVSKSGDVNQIIDEIAHEVEHVVSNRKVEEMSKADKGTQDYRAYEMLKRTVDKIGKWTPTNRTEIQRRLANIKTTLEQDGEIKAIQELVSTYNGEESVREELLNELSRSVKIKGVAGVLEYVRQAISKLINGTIKLDKEFSEGFNTGNIAVAAAYVAQEAREFEVDQVTDIDATGFAWNKDCKI